MQGFTIWITGLPGSGKAALARATAALLEQRGRAVEVIDSGALRGTRLADSLGFSRADREQNNRRHAFAAKLLTRNGVVAIVSSVSPYRALREALRRDLPGFVEVYVSTPKEVCVDRDERGVWEAALSGRIRNFTGVDDPYEAPLDPELTVDLSTTPPQRAAVELIRRLVQLERLTGSTMPGATQDLLQEQLEASGFSE